MKSLCTIVVVCALLCICTTAHTAVRYNITDLGTLGGASSNATAINNNGWVVGSSKNSSGQSHAFVWRAGIGLSDLHAQGYSSSEARAINDNGQVTGTTRYLNYFGDAFIWSPNGSMITLPKPPGNVGSSEVWGINSHGQVVGDQSERAVTWPTSGDVLRLPGPSAAEFSYAHDINDSGLIVGSASFWRIDGNNHRAVYWQDDAVHYLPNLSGPYKEWPVYAKGVNNADQIVGIELTTDDWAFVLWPSFDTVLKLGTLAESGEVEHLDIDINDHMQIVGSRSDSNNPRSGSAFIWESATGMVGLNTLIDPSLGWTLTRASGINNNGWIVGAGVAPNGQIHGYLLTPVPEPGSLVVLGSGVSALLFFIRRKRG